jgi:hypothetical protein
VQYRTINNALGCNGQQFGVGYAVEVFRQVGIYDLSVSLMQGFRYFIDRIMGGFLPSSRVMLSLELNRYYEPLRLPL